MLHDGHHNHEMFSTEPLPWNAGFASGQQATITPPPRTNSMLAPPPPYTRKDQKNFTRDERTRFNRVLQEMNERGDYETLIRIHLDKNNMMHSDPDDPRGTWRFLPWHRVYLKKFEEAVRALDSELHPGSEPLAVPYWRWSDPFPHWLPEPMVPGKIGDEYQNLNRNNMQGAPLPQAHIDAVLQRYQEVFARESGASSYMRFTVALEGRAALADGTLTLMHNFVHGWVGGVMATMASPCDPVFWLHHAEVDRLWHVWQTSNPNEIPNLTAVGKLDPWSEVYQDCHTIQQLGYQY